MLELTPLVRDGRDGDQPVLAEGSGDAGRAY